MKKRLAALVAAIALVACDAPQGAGPAAEPSGSPSLPSLGVELRSPSAPAIPIDIAVSRYGSVQVRTVANASCTLLTQVVAGELGDGPPKLVSATAGADGTVSWTYPAPLVPSGRGKHTVTCTDGARTAEAVSEFDIATRTIDPTGFTVRIQAVDPIAGLSGVTTRLDPSLVPARDADIARMKTTLENEWKLATRGLGALTLVPSSADIPVYVLPGKGTSVRSLASDGSQRVLLYAVDEFGAVSPENFVATALHELGHIWCCFGDGAGPDGHWLEKIADPLLQGVDEYGLMTHPVTCLVGRGFESCPNRFSERELRTMGFTAIPAPPPDPCITQRDALSALLTAQKATIDAQRAQLADLQRQIDAIKAEYPTLVLPPAVYATYNALVDQYNAVSADANAKVQTYNATVAQLNALPC